MSPPASVLAIDQGTTSTRAILFDANGRAGASAKRELKQIYPRPGWVEHDPEEIWESTLFCCREAAAAAPGPLAAVGIANQRETTVLWERASGKPVANAIVWQDRRTAELCRKWQEQGLEPLVQERTGLLIDPYFSASKIRWLLDTLPGLAAAARAGEIAFGTIDSFLLWRLSGGKRHATDVTNASRTMLFDTGRLCWDEELLDAFGIPKAVLPEVCDSDAVSAAVAPALLGCAVPIAGIAGDQHASLVGGASFRPGMAKATFGTGGFLLLNTGNERILPRHRLLSTIAYRIGHETAYALEGSIFVAGAALGWLCERLRILEAAAECDALASAADPRQRVYFVPAFTGLGAPYWEAHARGAFFGLTAECGRAEIVRAALEAVAYQSRDLVAAMAESAGLPISTLRVDGGLAASTFLMQFLADMLGTAVERPAFLELTAWGAAYLAGLAQGLYPPPENLPARLREGRRYAPQMPESEREERSAGWKRAVAATLREAAEKALAPGGP